MTEAAEAAVEEGSSPFDQLARDSLLFNSALRAAAGCPRPESSEPLLDGCLQPSASLRSETAAAIGLDSPDALLSPCRVGGLRLTSH